MNKRPPLLLILLLFVASLGALGWLYNGKAFRPERGAKSSRHEISVDLEACGHHKHLKARQYDHFAAIAAAEGRHTTERLFRAIACSEHLQEQNCASAIRRLGGRYTPPGEVALFGGTTNGNLERCLAFERYRYGKRSDAEIRRAMSRGNRYAARILIWAAAADLREIDLLERQIEGEASGFAVCPVCGNLYASTHLDRYCPHCLTSGEQFVRFEEEASPTHRTDGPVKTTGVPDGTKLVKSPIPARVSTGQTGRRSSSRNASNE